MQFFFRKTENQQSSCKLMGTTLHITAEINNSRRCLSHVVACIWHLHDANISHQCQIIRLYDNNFDQTKVVAPTFFEAN